MGGVEGAELVEGVELNHVLGGAGPHVEVVALGEVLDRDGVPVALGAAGHGVDPQQVVCEPGAVLGRPIRDADDLVDAVPHVDAGSRDPSVAIGLEAPADGVGHGDAQVVRAVLERADEVGAAEDEVRVHHVAALGEHVARRHEARDVVRLRVGGVVDEGDAGVALGERREAVGEVAPDHVDALDPRGREGVQGAADDGLAQDRDHGFGHVAGRGVHADAAPGGEDDGAPHAVGVERAAAALGDGAVREQAAGLEGVRCVPVDDLDLGGARPIAAPGRPAIEPADEAAKLSIVDRILHLGVPIPCSANKRPSCIEGSGIARLTISNNRVI